MGGLLSCFGCRWPHMHPHENTLNPPPPPSIPSRRLPPLWFPPDPGRRRRPRPRCGAAVWEGGRRQRRQCSALRSPLHTLLSHSSPHRPSRARRLERRARRRRRCASERDGSPLLIAAARHGGCCAWQRPLVTACVPPVIRDSLSTACVSPCACRKPLAYLGLCLSLVPSPLSGWRPAHTLLAVAASPAWGRAWRACRRARAPLTRSCRRASCRRYPCGQPRCARGVWGEPPPDHLKSSGGPGEQQSVEAARAE